MPNTLVGIAARERVDAEPVVEKTGHGTGPGANTESDQERGDEPVRSAGGHVTGQHHDQAKQLAYGQIDATRENDKRLANRENPKGC